jgi:glycosyl transferase family 99
VSIQKNHRVQAIISFLNCKSLDDVAGYLRIPVIHEEAGSIREPAFKFGTKIFDFSGANGNSEVDRRFQSRDHELTSDCGLNFIEQYGGGQTSTEYNRRAEPEFEVGIALQVEDDSNVVIYNNGWNSLRLIYKARQVFPSNQILVRPHPLSPFGVGDLQDRDLAVVDSSTSAMEFICKCKRILTINSSVAFEAIVAGRPTYILGDSPMANMAYHHFDRRVRDQLRDIPLLREKVAFYAFNYLVPRTLWLDPEYYRFRLASPSEIAIRKWHFEAIEQYCASLRPC